MTAIARRSFRTLVAFGVCVLAPALLASFHSTSVSSADASSCDALHEWSRAYVGTSPTLDTLAPFDLAHRRAIFNAVTPDVRSALWREHLRRIVQRSDLSGQQRELIADAIALSTPAMYAKDPAARRAGTEYWMRAQDAFPKGGVQRQLLFELGGPAPRPRTGASPSASAPSLWDRLFPSASVGAQTDPWCECSTAWQDCYWCLSSYCRWQLDGCGPYFWFECDGRCFYVEP